MVLSGKVREAVRMVTERDPGGLFGPSDLCFKTGHLVMDVLRDKHPNAVVPPPEGFDTHPDPPDLWDAPSLYCYEEQVAKAVARLSGGAGPCGVDGIMLRSCCGMVLTRSAFVLKSPNGLASSAMARHPTQPIGR